MPQPGFYAVRIGRQPGIYNDWKSCEAQINGFPNARHKKFSTLKEANEFIKGTGPSNTPRSTEEPPTSALESQSKFRGQKRSFAVITDESGWDVVYCDGASKGNGKVGAVAGLGIWWGEGDARNVAERCPGEQTNNRAELIAILRVLETTKISEKPLLIKTDSQYSIDCLHSWIHKWRENNWKTADGKDVKNEGIIRCISKYLEIRAKRRQKIHIQHVKGHSGEVGNEGADRLANEGAFMPPVQELDWKSLEDHLEEELASIPPDLEFDRASAAKSQKMESRFAASSHTSQSSSVGNIKASPPQVLMHAKDVDFEDYADCILDDDDLAKELSECM